MKTLFFVLHPANVFRNLFLPPAGVFDELAKNKDLKIIILASPGIANVMKNQYPEKLSKNIVLESIGNLAPQSSTERLFYFFYSYLIFTETTRMLASYGVRVDAPPAGGNRYLAFIKIFIARTFGRSLWVKRRLIPWLYNKVFTRRPYQYLFDRYQPDLVFVTNIVTFPDIEILAEAKRRGIKNIGMTSNWDHFNKYFLPIQSDTLLVQNEPMRHEAIELEAYKSEQVKLVGFPQFDLYAHIEKFTDTRAEFLCQLKIPANGKIISFISGAAHYLGEPDIIRKILGWIGDGKFGPNTYLLVRTYPGVTIEKFKEFQGNPHIVFDFPPALVSLQALRHFFNQMRHADVVVSIYSTTAIEAGILDKPLVTIGFDGDHELPYFKSIRRAERMAHIRHILDTGSVIITRSYDELFASIETYLKHPELDRDKRRILVDKMCYKIDGLASKRIADVILEAI